MKQLIVALDVDTAAEAHALAGTLRGIAGAFKIGSRLFTSEGPSVVESLVERGDRVFLDLKFHDIPTTVAGAVAAATRLGVWMVNVHASGGVAMMRAAREAGHHEAARLSRPAPLIIAVTVLTSLDEETLGEVGFANRIPDQVARLAALAQQAGLDGVVASPLEVAIIRQRCGSAFEIVTPGIRGYGPTPTAAERGVPGPVDDQNRTMSAPEALTAGATYLVVGRPIVSAADPRAAAERIAAQCHPS